MVGYEVARKLQVPLNVIISRKLGAPSNPELGIGAISEDGVIIYQPKLISALKISAEQIDEIEKKEINETKRRVRMYRKGKALTHLRNQVVILVDDGLATGGTAKAAILTLQKYHPKKIILALPVCSIQTVDALKRERIDIICTLQEDDLRAIGLYYNDFHQVSDEEVIHLLEKNTQQNTKKQLPFRFN